MELSVISLNSWRPLKASTPNELLHALTLYGNEHRIFFDKTLRTIKGLSVQTPFEKIDHSYQGGAVIIHIEQTEDASFALSIKHKDASNPEVRLARKTGFHLGLKTSQVSIISPANNTSKRHIAEIPEAIFLAINWAMNPDAEREPLDALLTRVQPRGEHLYSSIDLALPDGDLKAFIRFNGDISSTRITPSPDGASRLLRWIPVATGEEHRTKFLAILKVDICPTKQPSYSPEINQRADALKKKVEGAIAQVITAMHPNAQTQKCGRKTTYTFG